MVSPGVVRGGGGGGGGVSASPGTEFTFSISFFNKTSFPAGI